MKILILLLTLVTGACTINTSDSVRSGRIYETCGPRPQRAVVMAYTTRTDVCMSARDYEKLYYATTDFEVWAACVENLDQEGL